MDQRSLNPLFVFITLFLILPKCHTWGWFSSSSSSSEEYQFGNYHHSSGAKDNSHNYIAEFSMNSIGSQKGQQLVEDAKRKLGGSNTCWQNAYRLLFSGCSEIIAIEDKRSRFAWHLSDCFQKDSGRPAFPYCDPKTAMVNCLKKLDDKEQKIYLAYLLETNSICYQLQAHAFQHQTERLVNDLKTTSEYAEQKLENIELKSDTLLETSTSIQDSLATVDQHIQNVDLTAKEVQLHMDDLSKHSEQIYNQAKEIATSQTELIEGQARMKEKLNEGTEMVLDSYRNLGEEVGSLRNEAIEIEKEISKVGEKMYMKMENLQRKADDIETITGDSLGKQKQLLDGQSTAIDGIQVLTKFQSEALEESRHNLEKLAEYGQKQQEELLKRQEQLQKVHDHLVENTRSILAAQEEFESKQASMFIALDKLFALHNSMLLESRLIKAFFIYSMTIFIIYMFTSTKQTYTVRPRLYLGLVITFMIEVMVLRLGPSEIEQQAWMINIVRFVFLVLAAAQLLHAICTYRDYEVLNYHMLQTLMEKVNGIQNGNKEMLGWESDGEDSDVDWSSWVDKDLPEEVNCLEDPNYSVPQLEEECMAENSSTSSSLVARRRYHLRPRNSFSFR